MGPISLKKRLADYDYYTSGLRTCRCTWCHLCRPSVITIFIVFQPHTNHYISFSIGTNITAQQYYDLRNIFQAKQVQIRVYSGRDESRPFAIGSRVPQRTSTTTQTTVTRNSETVSQVRPMLQMMAYTPHPLLAFFNAAFQDRHLSFCRQLCHMCVLTTVTRIFTSFLEFALYRLKKQSEQG